MCEYIFEHDFGCRLVAASLLVCHIADFLHRMAALCNQNECRELPLLPRQGYVDWRQALLEYENCEKGQQIGDKICDL